MILSSEKWGQCLSSANDLVDRVYWDGHDDKEGYLSAVVPFVVIPNGRLWMVTYDDEGNRVCDPKPADRVSCFIGKDYEMGTKLASATMSLSHVEIITFEGMRAFIDRHLKTEEGIAKIFPKEGLSDAYKRAVKAQT